MTWQPIETAPKDWTHVLVADGNRLIGEVYYQRHVGEWVYANMSADDDGALVGDPTHWMPLPEPPK